MEQKIFNNKDFATLEQQYDWVADMKYVQQDPVHHAEGDVATHTKMVLKALENTAFYKTSDDSLQEILWSSALLHDVEKRSTTVHEPDGCITSYGHAKRGERTARSILFAEIPVPFPVREQVAALVRLHGLPLWLMEKPDPQKALLEASLRVNINALATLAEADSKGRVCNDQEQLLERIDFFRAYAEEQGCLHIPAQFATAQARYHYFNHNDVSRGYVPFEKEQPEIILLSGLPGMGKDHYLKKHVVKDTPVISLDEIRRQYKLNPKDKSANGWVAQQAKETAKELLRKKQSFVWNATNITKQMRHQLINLFCSYGARVKLVYIEVPYKQWLLQNSNREYALPVKILTDMFYKLEIPTPAEAQEVQYYINGQFTTLI